MATTYRETIYTSTRKISDSPDICPDCSTPLSFSDKFQNLDRCQNCQRKVDELDTARIKGERIEATKLRISAKNLEYTNYLKLINERGYLFCECCGEKRLLNHGCKSGCFINPITGSLDNLSSPEKP